MSNQNNKMSRVSDFDVILAVATIQDEDEDLAPWSSIQFGVHLLWRSCEERGEFEILRKDLWTCDDKFYDYFYMTQDSFRAIHEKVKHCLEKKITRFQKPMSSEHRLALCLR